MPDTSELDDTILCDELSKYAAFLEGAFVRYASTTLDGRKLATVLSEARSRLCPDATECLSPLHDIFRKYARRSPVVVLSAGKRHYLPLGDILYFTTSNDRTIVHTSSGRYICQKTLSQVEEELGPDGFVRSHRSYVVNISRVMSLEVGPEGNGIVTFDDGEHEAEVSKRKLREVSTALSTWARDFVAKDSF